MSAPANGLDQRRAALDAADEAYVHATVVRAQSPTSAWPGADAVVLADGSMEGFVGGQCAESSVRAAALNCLDSGEPLLLRILPEDGDDFPDSPGAQTVVNPCLSGGAIELFLAPRLPSRAIVVIGQTPIAQAVVALAESVRFSARLEEKLPAEVGGVAAVIVSSHGGAEAEAIQAALDAGVGFVGLVASRRRGAAVLDELDLDDADLAKVHTPVGLDIGAETPAEIALSILASVVREIRVDGLAATPGSPSTGPSAPPSAIDPICGMTVVAAPPTAALEVDGETHWFCNPGCREQFAEQAGVELEPGASP